MKKGLNASFMVALLLISVCSTSLLANAKIVSKEIIEEEEIFGTFELRITVFDEYFWPWLSGGLSFAKVVVTSEDNPNFKKVGFTGIFGICFFLLPEEYENFTFNAFKPRYEQTKVLWINKNEVDILMKYTGESKTLDNPFILEQFPILQKILLYLIK